MFNWSKIETVLLDMDGTLLDLKFDNYFWRTVVPEYYASMQGITVIQALHILEPKFKSQEGLLNWYCLDYWSEVLSINIADLKRQHQAHISVLPNTREFLQALKKSGVRRILVTNAHVDSLSLKMKKTGLIEFFDAVVCAHDFGYPKEHPLFWRNLQKLEPFNRQKTVLVDDSLAVLQSAEAYGIEHLVAITHPDSSEQPRQVTKYLPVKHLGELLPV